MDLSKVGTKTEILDRLSGPLDVVPSVLCSGLVFRYSKLYFSHFSSDVLCLCSAHSLIRLKTECAYNLLVPPCECLNLPCSPIFLYLSVITG